jgi:iron complex transport system permease protein
MRRASLAVRLALACTGGVALLTVAALVGMLVGSVPITPGDLWLAWSDPARLDPATATILLDLRLPRVLLGILVGASLALAGSGFQGILRNPLADPYIVGTSAGAALGASLAIVLHLPSPLPWLSPVPALAFLGALGAMMAVYRLARIGNTLPVETFLLAGVVVGSFAGAMVSFLMTLAHEDLPRVVFWLMGSLGQADASRVALVAPYLLIGGVALYLLSPALNLASMGDEAAWSLGVDVERLKIRVILAGSLVTAAAVSASGLIGFLGLLVPHLTRMLVGPDHRVLMPASALGGAAFLVLADTVARTVGAPQEIPVGVVTAMVGAPFFFWLLHHRKGLS